MNIFVCLLGLNCKKNITLRVLSSSTTSNNQVRLKKKINFYIVIVKGAKVTRSSRSYALPIFSPVPELSGPELASKSKDFHPSEN